MTLEKCGFRDEAYDHNIKFFEKSVPRLHIIVLKKWWNDKAYNVG
jgi:hypothetical protein